MPSIVDALKIVHPDATGDTIADVLKSIHGQDAGDTVDELILNGEEGGGAVDSVNGQTGTVVLDAEDVGALPDSTVIPTVPSNVSAFTNDAGYITASGAPVQSVNGQTGAVTTPNTTYTISISGNVITLTPSSGTAQSITLPVYSGGVI